LEQDTVKEVVSLRVIRLLLPTAAQRLIELNDGEQFTEPDLGAALLSRLS
jgi:hypothetical protein